MSCQIPKPPESYIPENEHDWLEHPPWMKMYFLLQNWDFPSSHVSFRVEFFGDSQTAAAFFSAAGWVHGALVSPIRLEPTERIQGTMVTGGRRGEIFSTWKTWSKWLRSFFQETVGKKDIQSSIFQGTTGLYMAYIGISHRGTLVGIHPTSRWIFFLLDFMSRLFTSKGANLMTWSLLLFL